MENRKVVLAERPTAMVGPSTTRVESSPVPTIGPDEALIKVGLLSIDPTIRTWMNDAPGYLPPIQIGEVIRSMGAGVVVETNSARYQVGDIVIGTTGWQEYAVATEANRFNVVPTGTGLDLPTVMNVLGITGLTAYFGLLEVGSFKAGDVVVVSGAAGATGSVVGQIAKAKGAAKVIGIAGGPEKCAEVVEKYGFDACLDYKSADWGRRLFEEAPKGVDLYFDNVGGQITDTVLLDIAMNGRVVLCGAIASYNSTERTGLANTSMLIVRRGRMEGFIILDFASRYAEGQLELAGMVLNGQIHHQEHLVRGLENAPDALNLLFTGGNHGKTLVVVDDSVVLA